MLASFKGPSNRLNRLCENLDGPQSRFAGLHQRPQSWRVRYSPTRGPFQDALVVETESDLDTNVVRTVMQSRKAGLRSG
jgi:hypothetical protein